MIIFHTFAFLATTCPDRSTHIAKRSCLSQGIILRNCHPFVCWLVFLDGSSLTLTNVKDVNHRKARIVRKVFKISEFQSFRAPAFQGSDSVQSLSKAKILKTLSSSV